MRNAFLGVIAIALFCAASSRRTVEVLVTPSATKMPQTPLRQAVELQNLGANSLWCVMGANSADAGQPYYPDAGPVLLSGSARKIAAGAVWGPLNVADTIPVFCLVDAFPDAGGQYHGAATIYTETH